MAGRATFDFFEAQAAARRRTALLAVLMALAWAGTVLLVHAGLALTLHAWFPAGMAAWDPRALGITGASVTLVMAAGGAVQASRLGGGGAALATLLGGAPVDRRSEDAAERRLINVAEEMAIASGLPVPALFVLPDRTINAFAAGRTPEDAVVAVTRGALDALDRDELQGVVAHELSHVLNSDARLNLRLVSIVAGLTALALVGRVLLRIRSTRGRRGGNPLPIVGLALLLAGSVGAFFARLIRLAVSRQREYLADAAAVQFTRNPGGLAGALAKIAAQGSAVSSAYAVEASHLFFARAEGNLFARLLATHPPLDERIRRIAPQGAGPGRRLRPAGAPGAASPPAGGAALAGARAPLDASGVMAAVAHPSPEQLATAGALLAQLSPAVLSAAREGVGAATIARALLLDRDPAVRERQLETLSPAAAAAVRQHARAVEALPRPARLALLEVALPSLDGLDGGDALRLRSELEGLAAADPRTSAFEWMLLRVVRRRLARLAPERPPAVRARHVSDVQVECLELLSLLAWAGTRDAAHAQAALDAAATTLGAPSPWRLLPRERLSVARVDAALAAMDATEPRVKSRVLEACAASVLADGAVSQEEAEVIRAVAAALGCPLPPLELGAPATAPSREAPAGPSRTAGGSARAP